MAQRATFASVDDGRLERPFIRLHRGSPEGAITSVTPRLASPKSRSGDSSPKYKSGDDVLRDVTEVGIGGWQKECASRKPPCARFQVLQEHHLCPAEPELRRHLRAGSSTGIAPAPSAFGLPQASKFEGQASSGPSAAFGIGET